MKVSELYVGYLGIVNYLGEGKGSEWTPIETNPYVIVEEISDGILLDVISGKKYCDWKKYSKRDVVLLVKNNKTFVANKQPLNLYIKDEYISFEKLEEFLSDINMMGNEREAKRTR